MNLSTLMILIELKLTLIASKLTLSELKLTWIAKKSRKNAIYINYEWTYEL